MYSSLNTSLASITANFYKSFPHTATILSFTLPFPSLTLQDKFESPPLQKPSKIFVAHGHTT